MLYCDRCKNIINNNVRALTKGELGELLVKAVIDNKISDIKLFYFEGGCSWPFTSEEEDILWAYHLGIKVEEFDKRSEAKRMLRPVGD